MAIARLPFRSQCNLLMCTLNSSGAVLEKVESLVDVNFALQFPKVKADNAKVCILRKGIIYRLSPLSSTA